MEKPYILYDNRLDDGTPTATTTASGYSVMNLNDWRSYTYWKPSSTATQYITIDCGSAKSADSLAIFNHDLNTRGASISVECSSDNFATDVTVALASFAPSNDRPIFKTFTSISKRYWRLKITGLTAACYIAILDIGVRITFERYLLEGFDPADETVKGESTDNITGSLLGSVLAYREKGVSFKLRLLTDSWFNNTFYPAWSNHLSLLKPFFWEWNYTNYPEQLFLVAVKPGAKLSAPYEGLKRQTSLEFVGVI